MTKERQRLDKLTGLLRTGSNMLIVMQDAPDPDAIAAAAALRQLANVLGEVVCTFTYGETVGRAENRALVKYLNLKLRLIEEVDIKRFDLVAMVDTQPGTGNNSLPIDIIPDIVIDHHQIRSLTRSARFTDIRKNYGATATILYQYLKEAEIKIDVSLATALLYGIRSDTQDLGREAVQADTTAYLELYPLANKRMLSRIEHATVPKRYFQVLANALANAEIVDKGIYSSLGHMDNPDMIGEVADLLLRNEDTVWVLCYGVYQERVLLSLRTSDVTAKSAAVMHKLVGRNGTGGGHDTIAGGQIPLKTERESEIRRVERSIQNRFRRFLKASNRESEPLVLTGRRTVLS